MARIHATLRVADGSTRWALWFGPLIGLGSALVLTVAILNRTGTFHETNRAPRAALGAPGQATEVPPIATCEPTAAPGTPVPPGLYPIVSIEEAVIFQYRLPDGCPTIEMRLRVCMRNDGPAPSGDFPLRIQGCGVGRLEVEVQSIEMFERRCIEVAGAAIPPGSCELMIDPGCKQPFFQRYWTGSVGHPEPAPTCTPSPSPQASPSATVTATATITATPTVLATTPPAPTSTSGPPPLALPLLFRNAFPPGSRGFVGCPLPAAICAPCPFCTSTPLPDAGTPTTCPTCRPR